MPSPTPMDQQIMDAINRQSSIGADIKARYTNQPTFEANTRATVFGQDKPLNDLMGGFSDKVAELFKYDQSKNAQYSAPVTTQGGESMMVNPMIQATADRTFFNKAVDDKETAWKLYETRKNILGDVMDKALKAYEAETQGMKVEADVLNSQINNLMDIYKESNSMALEEKKLKSSLGVLGSLSSEDAQKLGINQMPKTEKERSRIENKYNLSQDVANGMKFEDAVNRYGAILEKDDIVNVYNNYSNEPMTDSKKVDEYYRRVKKFGSTNPLDALDSTQSKLYQDIKAFLTDAEQVRTTLATGAGGTGPVSAMRNTKLAGMLGIGGSDAVARIASFKADIVKDKYGSALTQTEKGSMNEWVPQSVIQENANKQRIEAIYASKYNSMKALLTTPNIGMSDKEADDYLISQGITPPKGVNKPSLEELFK